MTAALIGIFLYIWCTLVAGKSSVCSVSCTKTTTSGTLKGICGNKLFPVDQYLSVPYSEPPLNDKRFTQSSLYSGTGTTHICTTLPAYCIQPVDVNMSEDCLYLNVYNPISNTKGKPIMVWIHGGSFLEGGSADPTFNGTSLAMNNQVIVITLNYRLGILGFYDSSDYGTNFGVQDVIIALEWVQKNAQVFGGDPNKVTIFGESSGATMIRALLTSSKAKNLFQRAILQSDPQSYDANPQVVSRYELGPLIEALLGCTNADCVKSASIDNLLQATVDIYSYIPSVIGGNSAYPLGPNIDYDIIPAMFAESVRTGDLQNRVELMVGFTYNESNPVVSQSVTTELTSSQYDVLVATTYGVAPAAAILTSGLFDQTTNYNVEFAYLDTLWAWTCPVQSNVQQLVKNNLAGSGGVYVYELANGIEYTSNQGLELCNESDTVCHEDDLYLIWGTYDESNVTDAQVKLSKELQLRWTSFAKTGSPNTAGYSTWTPAESTSNLNVKLLGYEEKVLSYSNAKQCKFIDANVPYAWEGTESL